MTGYARIFRSLLGHPAFRNDAEAMAFAWMILHASWRQTTVRYKGRAVTLERGQLATSIRDMAAALDRDKAWVDRLWQRLRREAMIETRNETACSVITLCNYDRFQHHEPAPDARSETPFESRVETITRQSRDTEQKREERKKDPQKVTPSSEARPAKSRAKQLPEDWRPADIKPTAAAAYRAANALGHQALRTELEKFRNHFAGQRQADWDATWRNWVIRASEWRGRGERRSGWTEGWDEKPSGWSTHLGFSGSEPFSLDCESLPLSEEEALTRELQRLEERSAANERFGRFDDAARRDAERIRRRLDEIRQEAA